MTQEPTILIPAAEACRLLAISRTSLWRLAKREEITQVRLGSRSYVVRSSLDELIDRKASTQRPDGAG